MRTETYPDKDTWLAARRKGIGASEVAAVLGLNPWRSPLAVFAEKIGLGLDKAETEAMQWGLRLEEPIADAYREETGRVLRNLGRYTICWSEEYPWLSATMDRIIEPVEGKEGEGCLEIKTAGFAKSSAWEDEPPVEYQIQNQAQMIVAGLKWGSVAGLIGGQRLLWADVEAHREMQRIIVENTREFWAKVVVNEPPVVGADEMATESTKEALKALYPADTGDVITLPVELIAVSDELEEKKEMEKDIKKHIEGLKNQLGQAIGAATRAVLPNGRVYSYKLVHKEPYTVTPRDYRELRKVK